MKQAIAVIVAVGLLFSGSALAAEPAPKFTTNLIVPGVSIGGVKLDASAATARRVFGNGQCDPDDCGYQLLLGGTSSFEAEAQFLGGSKVLSLQILEHGPAKVPAKYAALKTSRGIGLGSTLTQVQAAYPHGTQITGGMTIDGPGKHNTRLEIYRGKVTAIEMAVIPLE